jgi:hypothetical protein
MDILESLLDSYSGKIDNSELEKIKDRIYKFIPQDIRKHRFIYGIIKDIAKMESISKSNIKPKKILKLDEKEFVRERYPNVYNNSKLKDFFNVIVNSVQRFINSYNKKVEDKIIKLSKSITKKDKIKKTNIRLKTLNTRTETNNIKKADTVNADIKIEVTIPISDETVIRYISFTVQNIDRKEILEIIKIKVAKYVDEIAGYSSEPITVKYQIDNIDNEILLTTFDINDIKKMYLNNKNFVKLPYDIEANDAIIRNNCVLDAIEFINKTKTYNIAKKWLDYMLKKDIDENYQWTVENTVEALDHLKISYKIFSQFGDLLREKCYNKRSYQYMIFANEHLYHLESNEVNNFLDYIKNADMYLKKINITDIKLNENIIDYYLINHQIKSINLKSKTIKKDGKERIEYEINKLCVSNEINSENATLYVDKYTMDAYNFYKSIDIEIFLSPKFNYLTPLEFIAKRYNLYSTMTSKWNRPKAIHMSVNGNKILETYDLVYDKNEDILDVIEILKDNGYELHSIDLNKAYSTCISDLEFVPIINSDCEGYKYNGEKIIETNFYIVEEISEEVYGFVNIGIQSGYRLKCFDQEYYKISHVIEPIKHENPYKKLVKKMIKTNPDISKDILNKFYGNMQHHQNDELKTIRKIVSVFKSTEETKICKGAPIKVDGCFMNAKEYKINKKYNKNLLPFAHYIVDMCIYKIMNTVKELGAKIDSIIEIKTDSLTYIGKKPDFELGPDIYGGYKEIEIKIRKTEVYGGKSENSFRLKKINEFELDKNILGCCYAGSGKTHYIKNTIIPKLVENNKKYIVCCSQWQPITEYKKFNVDGKEYKANIHTIQHLETVVQKGKNILRGVDYLIIDEAGLLTYKQWEFITMTIPLTCKIIAFGDPNQLQPVDIEKDKDNNKLKQRKRINPLSSITVISLFDCKMKLRENYRNNYTIDEYNKMIDGTYVIDKEQELFNRRSDYVICYRNDTREKINKEVSKDWVDSITLNDKEYKIKEGARIICKTNNLKEYNIYNKQIFDVVSFNEKLKLTNHFDNTDQYEIPLDTYNNFDLAFGLTLYCVQGMSIDIDKISFSDIDDIKRMKGGLYTALSRCKF